MRIFAEISGEISQGIPGATLEEIYTEFVIGNFIKKNMQEKAFVEILCWNFQKNPLNTERVPGSISKEIPEKNLWRNSAMIYFKNFSGDSFRNPATDSYSDFIFLANKELRTLT